MRSKPSSDTNADFFGLIAEGWEVEDTTGQGSRGALPPEAVEVERLVGLFDSERRSGTLWTLAEINEFAPRPLTEDQVQRIRRRRNSLFQEWSVISPGQVMELRFP